MVNILARKRKHSTTLTFSCTTYFSIRISFVEIQTLRTRKTISYALTVSNFGYIFSSLRANSVATVEQMKDGVIN